MNELLLNYRLCKARNRINKIDKILRYDVSKYKKIKLQLERKYLVEYSNELRRVFL